MYEALELRDNSKEYHGKGVSQAIRNVNEIIAPSLLGKDPRNQKEIDDFMVKELDGSKNDFGWCKSKLGANAILGVSLSVCRAGAAASKLPLYKYLASLAGYNKVKLPVPSFNILNGGTHAGNNLAMQEFMVMPVGAKSFKEAMRMGSEIYHHLKSIIKKKYGQDAANVGDEGGFAPNIKDNLEALNLVRSAIAASGYQDKVKLATDVAASEFYVSEKMQYDLNFKVKDNDGSGLKNTEGMVEIYESFVNEYGMALIEDPFDQDDWESWKVITKKMNGNILIIGDDLLVTNPKRIELAIEKQACNGLLLKVNQIGSVSESIESVKKAREANWVVMTSHRSGETEDSFIADLAVGLSTNLIKTGAPCRSERLSKYNQLLRIEEELGDEAVFTGLSYKTPVKM